MRSLNKSILDHATFDALTLSEAETNVHEYRVHDRRRSISEKNNK